MREVLHNILTEIDISTILVTLIKIYLNEIIIKFVKVKTVPIKGDSLSLFFQICFRMHKYEDPRKPGKNKNKWEPSASGLC
jgi:hypothetical protein